MRSSRFKRHVCSFSSLVILLVFSSIHVTFATTTLPSSGQITVSDGKFIDAYGNRFIPIGHSVDPHPIRFYYLTDGLNWGSTLDIDAYFANMHANGENVLRLLFGNQDAIPRIEHVVSGNIVVDTTDWGKGTFVQFLDEILSYCDKYNIYLIIGVWSWWSDSSLGGYYNDFFSHYDSNGYDNWAAQKATVDYLAANWGTRDHIFAWEIYNEISHTDSSVDTWVDMISSYFRSKVSQMLTISMSSLDVTTPSNRMWVSPNLDFASCHNYGRWFDSDLYMKQGLTFAVTYGGLPQRLANVSQIVQRAKSLCGSKPFMDTEIPGIPTSSSAKQFVNNMASDEDYAQSFYDVHVAYLNAGAAGPGLDWATCPHTGVDGSENELSTLLYAKQLALSSYVASTAADTTVPTTTTTAVPTTTTTTHPTTTITTNTTTTTLPAAMTTTTLPRTKKPPHPRRRM